jgi:hypothetical protein
MTEIIINSRFELFKSTWKRLSQEGRITVASKAQLSLGYCTAISASAKRPQKVPNSTIYDLSTFAADQMRAEYETLLQRIEETELTSD